MRGIILFGILLCSVVSYGQLSPLSADQLKENDDVRKRIFKDDFRDYREEVAVDSQFSYQQRVFIPYNPIREADVMWGKRIWRDIPVKERVNYPLFYPHEQDSKTGSYIDDREPLFKILVDATKNGDLISFYPYLEGTFNQYKEEAPDDEFNDPMTVAEFEGRLQNLEINNQTDAEGNIYVDTTVTKFWASNVEFYRLKEDWYFDKQRSQMLVKIIGICPYIRFEENGVLGPPIPVAWFYFPHVRYILANKEAYNIQNEYVRVTFDDIFMKRRFSSYIIKEGNVYDRQIQRISALSSMDKLFESEKIKKEMFEFEHDLWDY